jgi:hypothetical protein
MATPLGLPPTVVVWVTVLLEVLMTLTVPEVKFST